MKITAKLFYYKRVLQAEMTCRRCNKVLAQNKDYQTFCSEVTILSREDTVRKLMEDGCSVSRYGDGEFYVMRGGGNGFQQGNDRLSEKLKEALSNPLPNLLLCIPKTLVSINEYELFSRRFILDFLCKEFNHAVSPFVNTKIIYGDALFTRFYMNLKNKNSVDELVPLLKRLWQGRDLLIVEGEYSRLGVGNDLFDNANSIKRILCPSVDAFKNYDAIFESTRKHGEGRLIIMAIGMTATVLAYDLAKEGFQALDLGHIDVEYEWYKRKAKTKIPLPYKAVNEAGQNINIPECNVPKYINSIVQIIKQS